VSQKAIVVLTMANPRKPCFTRFGEMFCWRFCVGVFYMFLRAVTGVSLYLVVFILIFVSGPNVADFVA
jgi:hypothetical protein